MTEQGHADGTLPDEFSVKTIMDTWTLQMGYPIIDVKLNGDNTATVSQVGTICNFYLCSNNF